MLQKTLRKTISLLVFTLPAVCASFISANEPIKREVLAEYTFDLEEYYEEITEESGTPLLGQLHDLITRTHAKYTSYNDCKNVTTIMKTDPGDDEHHVRDFYTQSGSTLEKTWNGTAVGTWNREHVWPKSLSNGLWSSSEVGGGADIHHVRPEEVRLNGDRGNKPFGNVARHDSSTALYAKDKNGNPITDYLGGYTDSVRFEPPDCSKGDVARIVLYAYTHYNTYSKVGGTTNGTGQTNYFGTLPITNIISVEPRTEENCFQVLVDWSNMDPVSEVETIRNDEASKITGNRNPFIDHPEYVNAIWGDEPIGKDSSLEEESTESEEESSFEESSESVNETSEGESIESFESIEESSTEDTIKTSAVESFETQEESSLAENSEEESSFVDSSEEEESSLAYDESSEEVSSLKSSEESVETSEEESSSIEEVLTSEADENSIEQSQTMMTKEESSAVESKEDLTTKEETVVSSEAESIAQSETSSAKSGGGCGGTIAGTSLAITSISLVGLFLIRHKKKDQ